VGVFTWEQAFFIRWGQAWCTKMRDEALRQMVGTDPHAPSPFRVNGPLSNMPEFAEAFGCNAGAKMVRSKRCEVW
jgi:predicted metalloendopeptidase